MALGLAGVCGEEVIRVPLKRLRGRLVQFWYEKNICIFDQIRGDMQTVLLETHEVLAMLPIHLLASSLEIK